MRHVAWNPHCILSIAQHFAWQLVRMLQQHHRSALRHETASVATCTPPRGLRKVSCGASQRDVSARVASLAVSAPTAESSTTQTSKASKPYRVTNTTIQDIKDFHKSQLCEYDYVVDDSWVEGTIPQELVGTYLRNGPGMQSAGRHTFDGDGQIVAFSFDGSGRVRFTNKFVRTRGFLDEQAAGRPVHRTAFTRGAADGSLLFNPFDMQMKNVANTGVLHWGNKLLALYESNQPIEMDASSLNTFGECNMNGQLQTPVLAAHYRVMPGRQQLQQQQQMQAGSGDGHQQQQQQQQQQGQIYSAGSTDGRTFVGFSFNTAFGSSGADMIFYEFAEDGSLRCEPQHHTLPGVVIALIHDIAVTPDYYVVVVGPIDFSLPKFVTQYMTSRCSIAECMEYKPNEKATTVHLVPRPGGKSAGTQPYVMEAPSMFTFHHVNAFQVPAASSNGNGSGNGSGRELLVLDTVGWNQISFESSQHNLSTEYYKGGNRPELQRLVFELDPAVPKPSSARNGNSSPSSSSGHCISSRKLVTRTMEFPCVNWDMHGQQHGHMYACADTVVDDYHWGPTQSVLKVSFDKSAEQDHQAVLQPPVQTQAWDAGPRRYVNEPLFVPKPNPTAEDDGWILAILHNAETDRGELVILDAQRFEDGPLATVRLPHHLAAGLHGSFSPKVLLKGWEEAAGRDWRQANVVRQI